MVRAAAIALIASGFAQAAAAQSVEPPVSAPAVSAQVGAPSPSLTPAEMDALSGGAGVEVSVLTRQQITGQTTGNTVNAGVLTTGDVTFSPQALDGFSGVGNFVINTGANNTLQGAINISVVTTPGAP